MHKNRAKARNNVSAEHNGFAHPIVYYHLRKLFELIIKHGHVPNEFIIEIIIPILKDNKKDRENADNYRPITIICLISKVFKMRLNNKIGILLNPTGLQLGFVREGGCDKSLYNISNVANYFLKRQSNVYIVTLDASAAFDKVNLNGLLSKLIKKGVSYVIMRVLLSWYTNSKACLKLNDHYTDYITIKSGLKQGGLLSPIFYNLYVDELMKTLMKATLGCSINGVYYGTIFYADDTELIGALVRNVQAMIDVCCMYFKQFVICLYPLKTYGMGTKVHNHNSKIIFIINDFVISKCGNIKYLGVNMIVRGKMLTLDVDERIRKFNAAAFDVLLNISDTPEIVRCALITKKCLLVLMYGIGAVEINQNPIYKLHIAYRKIFRYIFKLSKYAHLSELLDVYGIKSIDELNKSKIYLYYKTMYGE